MGELGEGNPEGGYDRGARLRRRLGSPHSNAEPGKVVEEGRSAAGSPGGPLGQCRGFNHIPLTVGPSHPALCHLCPERGHSCWEGRVGVWMGSPRSSVPLRRQRSLSPHGGSGGH